MELKTGNFVTIDVMAPTPDVNVFTVAVSSTHGMSKLTILGLLYAAMQVLTEED